MANIRRGGETPLARRENEWDPFRSMRELMNWDPFNAFPRLWQGGAGSQAFAPAFDVRETKDAYLFKADLPGFRDEDVEINVNGNRLTIAGKREAEQVERSDTFYCAERSYGSFSRSFTLPEGANTDQIEAKLDDGILSVRVPRAGQTQPRKVALQSGRGRAEQGGSEQRGRAAQAGEQAAGEGKDGNGGGPSPNGQQDASQGSADGEYVQPGRGTDESQVP